MIQFNSFLLDRKIRGINVSGEISLADYIPIAYDILSENELQRKRVSTDRSPYKLLSRDLVEGCVMPPITLAATEKFSQSHQNLITNILNKPNIDNLDKLKIEEIATAAFKNRNLIILDGLKRTYTILELNKSSDINNDELKSQKIRFEIYIGLSKNGILYRMMTLNTAQTPMSFRHQLEILYHDYINRSDLPCGIEIIKESDSQRARGLNRYQYRDAIDLFYAYSSGSSTPADKSAIIDKLAEFEFLENYKIEHSEPLELLILYHSFAMKINELVGDTSLDEEDLAEIDVTRPFGRTVESIFCRSQSMTGFGAEIKRLLERGYFKNIKEVSDCIYSLQYNTDNPKHIMIQIVKFLDEIALNSKRIGNDQRSFFQLFWRNLIMPEAEHSCDLVTAPQEAYKAFVNMYR